MDEHMIRVRERLADPQTDIDAQARHDVVAKRLKAMHINELALALQNEKRGPKHRRIWLKKIGDTVGKALDGVAPCRDGCSHCCNMATLMSLDEAREVERATGRKLTMPTDTVLLADHVEAQRDRYNGVPCSMLKDGRCSIYDVRPFSCRVHYVLDADDLLCKIIPGEHVEAPMFNTNNLNMLFMLAHVNKREDVFTVKMADVREFFPEGV